MVLWLIEIYVTDYITEAMTDILRQMIAVLVKKENIPGLRQNYDALAARYFHGVSKLADKAKYTARLK